MKTFAIILLAGLAFVAGSPAFAGRDGTQTMQQQLAQAKKAQAGLAGAIGAPGKVGPQGQPATPRRDPSIHP
jgi:hypothetical protein